MQIKTLEVAGFHSALKAMRNPMDSWAKSDSHTGRVGKKDRELSMKLAKAGTEHAKHLRMVMVWSDITAPRYWWTEFDTYRIGVEKVSCSTMHKLMARPLSVTDFQIDTADREIQNIADALNYKMECWKEAEDEKEKKDIWRQIIQLLPQSYLQTRTVMMSYAALRNIYRQREGHKLVEWQLFRDWVESLPESWMITDKLPIQEDDD